MAVLGYGSLMLAIYSQIQYQLASQLTLLYFVWVDQRVQQFYNYHDVSRNSQLTSWLQKCGWVQLVIEKQSSYSQLAIRTVKLLTHFLSICLLFSINTSLNVKYIKTLKVATCCCNSWYVASYHVTNIALGLICLVLYFPISSHLKLYIFHTNWQQCFNI